jgi:uncharacterized protein (TIGR02466 family)
VAVDHLSTIDNDKLTAFCLDKIHKSIYYTEYQDPQSGFLDLSSPELIELISVIETKANELFLRTGFNPAYYLKVARAWANLNNPSETRIPHQHHQTMFSCVYYVSGNEASGSIRLMNPVQSKEQVLLPAHIKDHNQFTSSEWSYSPIPGRLVMFPGWIYHYVENNHSNQDRISIAFDTVLVEHQLNN